jgi:DNA-binding NtrC family response regulator
MTTNSPAVPLLSRQSAETPEERPATDTSLDDCAKEREAGPLSWALEKVIRAHTLLCLAHFAGDVVKAAKALGIGKTTMYRWLKEWDVKL